MAKKVKSVLRLHIPAGKATPAPPIGPALGQHGVNIMAFCREYNDRTASQEGTIIPVELTIYEDRSFTFVTRTPLTTELLKKALGLEKGGTSPSLQKVGKISSDKIREIAQLKLKDLNTTKIESAMHTVEGTARSMGIEVVE